MITSCGLPCALFHLQQVVDTNSYTRGYTRGPTRTLTLATHRETSGVISLNHQGRGESRRGRQQFMVVGTRTQVCSPV